MARQKKKVIDLIAMSRLSEMMIVEDLSGANLRDDDERIEQSIESAMRWQKVMMAC